MRTRVVADKDPFGTSRARALTAAAIPVHPPDEWFHNPGLTAATPLTVDDDGHVHGHIATWKTSHIGRPQTRPPRSRSNYSFFRTGLLRTASGVDVPVGQLTLAGGHAPVTAGVDAAAAIKHYDDTASAIADVNVGEDKHGIWASGALRPSATPEQIRALRASAPSGDWRPINGALELVAICQVNVPGFPVARACVASGSGQVLALVAAGVEDLYRMRMASVLGWDDRLGSLESQVESLTAAATRAELRHRVHAPLTAAFGGEWSTKSRAKAESRGQAMEGGSFPIADEADLKRAIKAFGRAKNKTATKRHIIKRARALGLVKLLPDSWNASVKSAA